MKIHNSVMQTLIFLALEEQKRRDSKVSSGFESTLTHIAKELLEELKVGNEIEIVNS